MFALARGHRAHFGAHSHVSRPHRPSGCARTWQPHTFLRTLHTFCGPIRWSHQHAATALISAHPSHVSWHRREFHRGPQVAAPACGHRAHFGAPFRRFVAPQGAPPRAPWLR
eukprot:3582472-Pyramimonas_sp.AAC.1